MEELYKDPHTLVRMREGPLGAYVDEFARQLSDEGYTRASCRYALQVVADLGCWLSQRFVASVKARLSPSGDQVTVAMFLHSRR
jgi:hypothetical protein